MPLVSYWPLDEDSGSTANDVRGSNDGTVNGATPGAEGVLGTTAYSFDGTDDYVRTSGLSSGNFRTISYWVYLPTEVTSSDTQGVLATKVGQTLPVLGWLGEFTQDVSGETLTIVGPNGEKTSMTDTVPQGWNMIQFVWNDSISEYDIYVNGLKHTTTSGAESPCPLLSIDDLDIGGRPANNDLFFEGRIEDVRVYDHSLSPQEIQYLYEVSQRGTFTTTVKS